jgi:hypothetical protein
MAFVIAVAPQLLVGSSLLLVAEAAFSSPSARSFEMYVWNLLLDFAQLARQRALNVLVSIRLVFLEDLSEK